MYRLLDLNSLTFSTADSLSEVARALHGRPAGSVIVDFLDELDGEQAYLPMVPLDLTVAPERAVILPHVS